MLRGEFMLLKKLVPSRKVDTVFQIPLEELWSQGIRGIITDLDNTLVGARVALATPELAEWLKNVQQRGFQIVIVSNNNRTRVSAFAEPVLLPFIHSARKPSNRSFLRAMEQMKLRPDQIVVVGDQMLTDVLGGNRLGLHTILVKPIAAEDEGFFTRVNRRIERTALRIMKNKH